MVDMRGMVRRVLCGNWLIAGQSEGDGSRSAIHYLLFVRMKRGKEKEVDVLSVDDAGTIMR